MFDFTGILFQNKDNKYRDFSRKLIPDTSLLMIGVRTPTIRNLAKTLSKEKLNDCIEFFNHTHVYYEEVFLHAELIAKIYTDTNQLLPEIEKFLPKIDNWAICDCFASSLKTVGKSKEIFMPFIIKWLSSAHIYTIRFAINLLLRYYINEKYIQTTIQLVKNVKNDNYYVNMALSWLWCECLIKFYDITVRYIQQKSLPKFVQNKSIQKAIESFRITEDKKSYLRTLKI